MLHAANRNNKACREKLTPFSITAETATQVPRLQNFLLLPKDLHRKFLQRKRFSSSLTKMLTRGDVAKAIKHAFSTLHTL